MKNKKRSILIIAVLALFMLIIFSSEIISFIANYQWFDDLGYTDVYLREFFTRLKIIIPIFILFLIIYSIYMTFLKRNYYKNFTVYNSSLSEKWVNGILLLPVIFFSFTISINIGNRLWFEILQFLNHEDFNKLDPIFGNDISFYVFRLPMYNEILTSLFSVIFVLVVLTIIFYTIMMFLRKPTLYEAGMDLNFKSDFMKKFTKLTLKQLAFIASFFFILLGIRFHFMSYEILYSSTGVVTGAGYTDVNVNLLFLRIQMVASILIGITILISYFKNKPKIALFSPIILFVIIFIGSITASIVQNFTVVPNEINREYQYIENNIEFTQSAYNLHNIERETFPVDNDLTMEDINNNRDTIDNIRINDNRPTLQTYNQIQSIRLYYRFNDVDIDRYYIDGEYRQVFISPRELDLNRLSDDARSSWINRHLRYTHGNGVVVSPVNKVTSEGQPYTIVSDIPARTDTNLTVDRGEIYFGELTDHYIIVNTKEEIDGIISEDETNLEAIYEGTAGIDLTFGNRLLYAIKNRTMKILLTDDIRDGSKIIYHRNIQDRVNKIAPFIEYDNDPYIVIGDGRLYWIIDGYTSTSKYPYSTSFLAGGNNYVRNSVKVVVDAYNGDVNYYIFDEEDPIIMTYKNIYPELFKSQDELPEYLAGNIRYPHQLFNIQAEVYKSYHMENPRVFYDQGNLWHIAKEQYRGDVRDVQSHYMVMKLPGEDKEEFTISKIYTPKDLNNMTAMLVARNDYEYYGQMKLYTFPRDRNIYGPMQIENRIDQRTNIADRLTLWSTGGTSVIRGNLLVVPIENSLLYVEPIYLVSDSEGALPEVKKIIVAYKDQIVMAKTLDEALELIFKEELGERGEELEDLIEEEVEETLEEVVEDEIDETDEIDEDIITKYDIDDIESYTMAELADFAKYVFDQADNAIETRNWAEYGYYIEKLEKILDEMQNK